MRHELAHWCGRDLLGCFIEHDPLDIVADVASERHVGDVGKRDEDEPAGMGRERRLG
jgi:hypothetical protein